LSKSMQYCRSYEYFFDTLVETLEVGCFSTGDERRQRNIEKAVRVLKGYKENNKNLFQCEGERRCVTGDVTKVDDYVINDNTVVTICPNPSDRCEMKKYKMQVDNTTLDIKYGLCMPAHETSTCDDVIKYNDVMGRGEITECETESCSTDMCTSLKATLPLDCKPLPYDKNVGMQLLPGATLRESLDGLLVCFAPYIDSLPNDPESCKKASTETVKCLSKVIVDFLSGRCPTVLDDIPGMRFSYITIREVLYEVSSVEEIVRRFRLLGYQETATLVENLEQSVMLCPDKEGKYQKPLVITTDFTKMAQEFFNSLGIKVEIPKIEQILPCDYNFLTLSAILQKNLYTSLARAKDKNNICKAYDYFTKLMKLVYRHGCSKKDLVNFQELFGKYPDNHEFAYQFETAVKVLYEFFADNKKLIGCDKERDCVTGKRMVVDGKVVEDNTYVTPCNVGNDEFLCMSEKYVLVSNKTPLVIEEGKCISSRKAYTCQDVSRFVEYSGMGFLRNCTMNYCHGDQCSDIQETPPPQKCPKRDIPLLPSCSFKDLLGKIEFCTAPFVGGLPYKDNSQQCLPGFEKFLGCISSSIVSCFSGRCSTALDKVPGMRSNYQTLVMMASQVRDFESFKNVVMTYAPLENVDGDPAEVFDAFPKIFCPEDPANRVLSHQVWSIRYTSLLNFVYRLMELLGFAVDFPVREDILPCKDEFFTVTAEAAKKALKEVVFAEDHQAVCRSYETFHQQVVKITTEKCEMDRSKIEKFFERQQRRRVAGISRKVDSGYFAESLLQFWDFFRGIPKLESC